MTTFAATPGARLQAVSVSAILGALAGACWALPGLGRPSGLEGVLNWAAVGLLLGTGTAAICVVADGFVRRWWVLGLLGMSTGLLLAFALTLLSLRGDSEKNDTLVVFGLLGLIFGLVVAAITGALLAQSSKSSIV